jgi:hypothetical protein
MLDAAMVLLQGDDIGDSFFLAIIAAQDELEFDTYDGAPPGMSCGGRMQVMLPACVAYPQLLPALVTFFDAETGHQSYSTPKGTDISDWQITTGRTRLKDRLHAGGQSAKNFNQVLSNVEALFDWYPHFLRCVLVNHGFRLRVLGHIMLRDKPVGVQESS